jgi:hypothetical protein
MSTDHLLRSLEQNTQAIARLRHHPSLYAAIACYEDEGIDVVDTLEIALRDFIRTEIGTVEEIESVRLSINIGGDTYGSMVYASHDVPNEQSMAAYRDFLSLAHLLSNLVSELPGGTRRRLGLREVYNSPLHDWIWVLFHMAWHFPEHFSRGVVFRGRLLDSELRRLVISEDRLQLSEVKGLPNDRYPGVIFSRFPNTLDLVTATERAIELIRQAVQVTDSTSLTDDIRLQFRRLHREFLANGEFISQSARKATLDLDVRVLRLDNSFRMPAASQWAEYLLGGVAQLTYFLSRMGCVKEVCVIRGAVAGSFVGRADRAGALLPAWSAAPAAALLHDINNWLFRVNRTQELRTQRYYPFSKDGNLLSDQPFPPEQLAQHFWESMRPSPGSSGLVTDHRGNVERWLGFVFYMLKEYEPGAIEICTIPNEEQGWCTGRNAILTLREINLFQASARAMELAGWIQDRAPAASKAIPVKKSGRPRDPVKASVARYIMKLKKQNKSWNTIRDEVFKKFGRKYAVGTLRSYHKEAKVG